MTQPQFQQRGVTDPEAVQRSLDLQGKYQQNIRDGESLKEAVASVVQSTCHTYCVGGDQARVACEHGGLWVYPPHGQWTEITPCPLSATSLDVRPESS